MRTVVMAIRVLVWSLLTVQLATTAALLVASTTDMRIIYITGGSMEPTYSIGDAVLIDVSGRVPSAGENVTFTSTNGVLTTHRVVSVHDVRGKPHLRTKGDANEDPDSDLVALESIKGISGQNVPLAGYALAWLTSPVGRLLTFGPVLLYFCVREALVIRNDTQTTAEQIPDSGPDVATVRREATAHRGRRRSSNPIGPGRVLPGRYRKQGRSPSKAPMHRGTL